MKDFEVIKNSIKELIWYELPIKNREDFLYMMKQVNTKWFNPVLLEKDFRLTVVLNYIAKEIPELRFKWWTCLNKVYFPYFRLSEDLDFMLPINYPSIDTNNKRKSFARDIRWKIKNISSTMGRTINDDKYHHKKAQWNKELAKKEHTYLKYILKYPSMYSEEQQTIKIEITYSSKQYLESKDESIKSIFIDPVLETPLFQEQSIQCLDIREMTAEKCRASMTRRTPVIRDFFDLRYLSSQWIDIFQDIDMIINKCKEVTDLNRTLINNYENLTEQIEKDLEPVLYKNSKFEIKNIYNDIIWLQQKILPNFK